MGNITTWQPTASVHQKHNHSRPGPFHIQRYRETIDWNNQTRHLTMNRPRNRQSRPPQQQQRGAHSGRGNRGGRGGGRGGQSGSNGRVPNIQQVVPGASVSIVLKEDQPTGHETAGVVSQVLTKGNHPRGIKVRLRDGQVGRVQRMLDSGSDDKGAGTTAAAAAPPARESGHRDGTSRFTHRYTDVREDDEFPEGPPPRSLADFFPDEPAPASAPAAGAAPVVTCPICGVFEGDEVAVSHHVETAHLT